MYKVFTLYCITQAIQSCKTEPPFLCEIFRTTKFLGSQFYNHVIKSILAEAELRADQGSA